MSQLLLPSMIEVKSPAISGQLNRASRSFGIGSQSLSAGNARVAVDILYRPSVEQCLEFSMAQVLRARCRNQPRHEELPNIYVHQSIQPRLESNSDEKVDFEGDTGEVVKVELSGVAGFRMKF